MTRKSGALVGLVALAVLALWGVALGLAGDDVPLVPPSVELGGPPVTVAPAVTAEGDEPAERGARDAAPGTERTPERQEDARADGAERRVTDERASAAPDRGETTVVTPLPVRVGGDTATPIAGEPAPRPTTSPAAAPVADGSTVDRPRPSPTTVPTPTTVPVTDEVAAPAPETSDPVRDPGSAPLHVTDGSCPQPGAAGLDRAAVRTAGTPASPPPRGKGPGCAPGAGGAQGGSQAGRNGDEDREGTRDDGPAKGELQAVRERDDEGHEPGRGRGGAGGGRRGAGGG